MMKLSIFNQLLSCLVWALRNVYIYSRRHPFTILLAGFFVFTIRILLKWGIMCTNMQPWWHIQDVCSGYASGASLGNLCSSLCLNGGISSLSCHNFYLGKEAVFSGEWDGSLIVFKSPKRKFLNWPENHSLSEEEFLDMLKGIIKLNFNITLSNTEVKRISFLKNKVSTISNSRHIEMKNVWNLFQDNEYPALLLYEKFNIFPRLVGSCGTLYAAIKLKSISGYSHVWSLYDSKQEWQRRVKLSIMILDYLHEIENKVPEPLYLCDIKMSHFGITNDLNKIQYLDIDSVHPHSVVDKITGDGSKCSQHSDCDYFDCRSYCNLVSQKCLYGVSNNNLQMVCERIFLGWMMSGKLLVPGLLLGTHTPQSLINLLESCANPSQETGSSRSRASGDIRKRLYNLLKQLL